MVDTGGMEDGLTGSWISVRCLRIGGIFSRGPDVYDGGGDIGGDTGEGTSCCSASSAALNLLSGISHSSYSLLRRPTFGRGTSLN